MAAQPDSISIDAHAHNAAQQLAVDRVVMEVCAPPPARFPAAGEPDFVVLVTARSGSVDDAAAKMRELRLSTASTNLVARRLYASLGFAVRTHYIRFYPSGQSALEMAKRL